MVNVRKEEKNGGRRNSCFIFNTHQAQTKFIKTQLKGSSDLELLYFNRLGVNIQTNGEGKN